MLHQICARAPNPAAAGTTLHALAEPARVVLGIYDAEGRLLRTLLDAEQIPGQYQAHWDAKQDGLTSSPLSATARWRGSSGPRGS
jgi:hypothetical protein